MRMRIIQGFFDGARIVLRFTPLMTFALPVADTWRAHLRLVVLHLVGRAVGDAATLVHPLARPGPKPELERVWQRKARKHNRALTAQKRKLGKAEQKKGQQLKEQRKVNGTPKVSDNGSGEFGGDINEGMEDKAMDIAHGNCNGVPKDGSVEKQSMLNVHASAKRRAG